MNSFSTTYGLWEKISNGDNTKFEVFAIRTHTVGNFVLVPYGFNRWRYSQTFDYWDKSLSILKEKGYCKSNKKCL